MSNETKQRWGRQPESALHDLQGQWVRVKMISGKAYRGKLTGASPYQIVIQQETGLELIVNKGAMIFLHKSATGGGDHSEPGTA